MKIRNPTLVRMAGRTATRAIKTLFRTVRSRYHPLGRSLAPADRGPDDRSIYAIWHENLLLPTVLFGCPEIAVLISRHADGRMLDELIGAMGMSSVRGSTNRGGVEALRQLVSGDAAWKHLAVTPDGPRGPRRIVQPGIIYVAARTGMSIVPVGVGYRKPIRFRSWDRFAIPKPFGRAACVTGEEIRVPESVRPDTLEPYRMIVQRELDRVTGLAERTAETGQPPEVQSTSPSMRRAS